MPITTAQVADFWFTCFNVIPNSLLTELLALTFFSSLSRERSSGSSLDHQLISSAVQKHSKYTLQSQQSCEFFAIYSFFLLIWFVACRMWRQSSMQPLGWCFNRQSRRKRKAKPKRPAPYCDLEIGVDWQRAPLARLLEIAVIPYRCVVADPFLNSRFLICFLSCIFNRVEYSPQLGKSTFFFFYGHKVLYLLPCNVAFGIVLCFSSDYYIFFFWFDWLYDMLSSWQIIDIKQSKRKDCNKDGKPLKKSNNNKS